MENPNYIYRILSLLLVISSFSVFIRQTAEAAEPDQSQKEVPDFAAGIGGEGGGEQQVTAAANQTAEEGSGSVEEEDEMLSNADNETTIKNRDKRWFVATCAHGVCHMHGTGPNPLLDLRRSVKTHRRHSSSHSAGGYGYGKGYGKGSSYGKSSGYGKGSNYGKAPGSYNRATVGRGYNRTKPPRKPLPSTHRYGSSSYGYNRPITPSRSQLRRYGSTSSYGYNRRPAPTKLTRPQPHRYGSGGGYGGVRGYGKSYGK